MPVGIRIVTDNCCDLPPDLLTRYQIELAHLRVRFGEREYRPGELSNAEFYKMMVESPVLPTTSQPPVEDMAAIYERLLGEGAEVISIHLSSGISGTVQGALVAAQMLDNPRLHIVDSKKASVGLGLLVREAAVMAGQGNSVATILERLREMQRRLQCIFMVGNLEALIKGGRISRGRAAIAGALNIKPILYFDGQGCIMPYDKVRGFRKALNRLLEIMGEQGGDLTSQVVGLCHSASPGTAEYLRNEIEKQYHPRAIIVGEVGPVIGSHVGPGTFSVFFETR